MLSRRLFRRLWVVLAGLCAGYIIYRIVDPVMCRFPTGDPRKRPELEACSRRALNRLSGEYAAL